MVLANCKADQRRV